MLSDLTQALVRLAAYILLFMPPIIPLALLPLFARRLYRAWGGAENKRAARRLAALVLALTLSDGLLLVLLPQLGLSFGPPGWPWLGMIVLRFELARLTAILWRRFWPARLLRMALLLGALNLALLSAEIYALYFEPFNLGVTQVEVSLPTDGPVQLTALHLSDFHVEYTTKRERQTLDIVEQIQPDVIFLTGDYLNLSYVQSERARQDTRELLGQLYAPLGVYAVRGTPGVETDESVEALFGDLDNVTLLEDAVATFEADGQAFNVVGVANLDWERDRDALQSLMSQLPSEIPSILLYHTPDLIETAAEQGVDLYLAGHTHGGQVRLPWFGALVTFSRYGKKYEVGLYHVGPTHLYVSRGLGMEGAMMPRVRFLCPPEIIEFTLVGK